MGSSEVSAPNEAKRADERPVALGFGSCPLPIMSHQQIVLGHGSGGKLTADLIDQVFLPAFKNPVLNKLDDQAVVTIGGARLAFTTDSFVVTPIFFPGGDIGRLAVHRDGERSGDEWCPPALFVRGLHPGGRFGGSGSAACGGVDAGSRGGSRSRVCNRRYQGRESR